MTTLDPVRMRRLVLAVGLAVLSVLALVMVTRGIDQVEVVATLLFIPIFVAFVLGRMLGGLAMALIATATYAALRYPAIQAVGLDRFGSLLASRALGYIVFGGVGGWAIQMIEASLTKLDLHDRIDDDTGLYNARALVQDLDLESARSRRYKTLFSVSIVSVPADVLEPLSRRKRRHVLRSLGKILRKSVRTIDRVAHARTQEHHLFAFVLPETEANGNEILTERLVRWVVDHLQSHGIDVTVDSVTHESITFPDEAEGLRRTRQLFFEIAGRLFPEDEALLTPAIPAQAENV